MSDVETNPTSIEQAIRRCSDRIADGVKVCNRTYLEFLAADRAYDVAVARVYLGSADHPAHERKHVTELATQTERQMRDVADAAYRYADRQARALEAELRALQSVGASVRAMFSVAGVGER